MNTSESLRVLEKAIGRCLDASPWEMNDALDALWEVYKDHVKVVVEADIDAHFFESAIRQAEGLWAKIASRHVSNLHVAPVKNT